MSLNENTSKIEQLLAAISALPEAGSGGEQATPQITVSSSGLITATAGDKSATKQLTIKAGTTVTPGTSAVIAVSSNKYTTGNIVVQGDADLIAENIKKGVTIFDVLGTFEGSGGGGGLPSGVSKLATNEYIPTEDVSTNQNIAHGLGVTPNFFVWWLVEDMSTTPVAGINIGGALVGKNAKYSATSSTLYTNHSFYRGYNATPQVNGAASSNAGTNYMNETNCRILCSTTYKLKAGYTYRWIAGVVDGIN